MRQLKHFCHDVLCPLARGEGFGCLLLSLLWMSPFLIHNLRLWFHSFAKFQLPSMYIYSAGQKKSITQKGYFWGPQNVLHVFFLFSYLKTVFCELMLLELGDLLGLSLLGNFFNAARSTFSCKYFIKIAQYFQFF